MDRKLINYLPVVVRDVKDYKVIMNSQQSEVEKLWLVLNNVIADAFTTTATKNGVERREKILKITPKGTDSLEERRFRIRVKENDQLPYTYKVLEKHLGSLCGVDGYALDINNEDYLVSIKLELKAQKSIDEISIYARKIVPSNMIIDIKIMYNQYSTIRNLTYSQLGSKTYKDIRNEVLM